MKMIGICLAWHGTPVQVICKEKCTGLEFSESRGQLDGSSEGKISSGVNHDSVFEQQANQVIILWHTLIILVFIVFK